MVGLLAILAALAAAPSAADDWKGGNYGGGRQWGNTYQSAQTTDFGGAPRVEQSRNDSGAGSDVSDDGGGNQSRGRRSGRGRKGSQSGDKKSGSNFEEKKDQTGAGDEPRSPEEARAKRGGSSGEDGGSGEGHSGPMSLADARENFQGVVESYVAKNSEDGVWTRREGKRTRRLTLAAVETSGVRATGRGLFTGPVAFRDERGRKMKLLFTVDFSKDVWTVSSVKAPTESAAHIVK